MTTTEKTIAVAVFSAAAFFLQGCNEAQAHTGGKAWETSSWYQPLTVYASLNGAGVDLIADNNCSVTACYFEIAPPSDETWVIHRMLVEITDGQPFGPTTYGGIATLTNGIHVHSVTGTGATAVLRSDLTGSDETIKSNASWGARCYDVNHLALGAGDDVFLVRWTFWEGKTGLPILLRGAKGERIQVGLNDDFSGLSDHRFVFQGERRNGTLQNQ
jgi:hypothetical protein